MRLSHIFKFLHMWVEFSAYVSCVNLAYFPLIQVLAPKSNHPFYSAETPISTPLYPAILALNVLVKRKSLLPVNEPVGSTITLL